MGIGVDDTVDVNDGIQEGATGQNAQIRQLSPTVDAGSPEIPTHLVDLLDRSKKHLSKEEAEQLATFTYTISTNFFGRRFGYWSLLRPLSTE